MVRIYVFTALISNYLNETTGDEIRINSGTHIVIYKRVTAVTECNRFK